MPNLIKIDRIWLQRYGDLTAFKMAAVRHLAVVKFKFLMVGAVKRPIMIVKQ